MIVLLVLGHSYIYDITDVNMKILVLNDSQYEFLAIFPIIASEITCNIILNIFYIELQNV